jgi:hypothetical protein
MDINLWNQPEDPNKPQVIISMLREHQLRTLGYRKPESKPEPIQTYGGRRLRTGRLR